jgi:ATP-binding protein involved in chromosome partitioning
VPVVIGSPQDAAAAAIDALAQTVAVRPRGLAGRSLPMRPE